MTETLTVLKTLINQKLIGVTETPDGNIHLHFEDWVIIVPRAYAYPSPIMERVNG